MLILLLTDASPSIDDAEARDDSFRARCGRLVALCNTVHGVHDTRYALVDEMPMLTVSIADSASERAIRSRIEQFGETLEIVVGNPKT